MPVDHFGVIGNQSLRRTIFAQGSLIIFVLDRQITGILVPGFKTDFGLTNTQVGIITGPAFAIMYATLGIPREDKAARIRHFAHNYELFGAPVVLFFSIDRRMGVDQWADLGMFMQNIMLLARERGLHTCAQEAWAIWYRSVAEFLQLPADHMLFCGMALGYMDEGAPANKLRTERAQLAEFATLRGFD